MADHLWQNTGMTAAQSKTTSVGYLSLSTDKNFFLKTSLLSKAEKYILKHFHFKS